MCNSLWGSKDLDTTWRLNNDKLLDKYLNVKRESLHGEKYSPVLEWAKKIFGPSPETPPSGGMIKKAGAPWPWQFLSFFLFFFFINTDSFYFLTEEGN